MNITKTLKYGTFIYDPTLNQFEVFTTDKRTGEQRHARLDKVYAFSLARFIIRIAYRNWLRRKK